MGLQEALGNPEQRHTPLEKSAVSQKPTPRLFGLGVIHVRSIPSVASHLD